jgi:alkylation response protein AidB-like acyl-CoA dehydrogenase
MDFQLSEEHKLIQETARRITRERIAPRAAEIDETAQYPEDIFEAFREVGLLGLTIPEQYGGSGSGVLAMALAVEEASKHCCSSGLIILLAGLGTQPIMIGGTDDQKRDYGGPVARGEWKCAYCLTEPNHGSDPAALETRAALDGDDYLLNGEKAFISGGSVADYVVVFARTDQAPGPRGISAFLVPKDAPGFSVTRTDRKMGVRGVPTAVLGFDNCRIPRRNLVGEAEGQGFRHAMLTLNTMRPVVGARGLGLAEGVLTYALDFARERQAFGGPIADLATIQFKFAEMAIEIEAARLLLYQAAWMVDQGRYQRSDAVYSSIAKAFATEMAVRASSEALQVLGAQGYMMDHPLERQYRDARQLMIVEGTSEIQRVVIARALLDRDLVYP